MKKQNKLANRTNFLIILAVITLIVVLLFWNNIFSGQLIKELFSNKEKMLTAEEKQEIESAVKATRVFYGNIETKYNIFKDDKGNPAKTEALLNELLSKDGDCIRNVNIATYMNRDYPEIVDKLCENINYECCMKVIGAKRCTQDYINEFKEDCRTMQFARYIW